MEREYWRWIARGLRRLPRWWPRNAVYDNREILAVLLWAALHGRSIDWACRRTSWPVQAWRRRLPDQSTLSRRLRDPRLMDDLVRLLQIVQRAMGAPSKRLMVDGKPLAVSAFSADPDARMGWGAGRHQLGYKLHALVDSRQRLLAWEVHPMNTAECVVARDLLRTAHRLDLIRPGEGGSTVLGDASYDSNPLHQTAAEVGASLVAPRRKAHRSISAGHRQQPGRLRSIELTEGDPPTAKRLRTERGAIERFFGGLATFGGGLYALPAWVRRLHRVRLWVGAKLVLNAARITLLGTVDA